MCGYEVGLNCSLINTKRPYRINKGLLFSITTLEALKVTSKQKTITLLGEVLLCSWSSVWLDWKPRNVEVHSLLETNKQENLYLSVVRKDTESKAVKLETSRRMVLAICICEWSLALSVYPNFDSKLQSFNDDFRLHWFRIWSDVFLLRSCYRQLLFMESYSVWP